MIPSIADELLVESLPEEIKETCQKIYGSENWREEEYERGYKDGRSDAKSEYDAAENREMLDEFEEFIKTERADKDYDCENKATLLRRLKEKLEELKLEYS